MLSDEVINKVIERITTRIEETNTYVIKKMAQDVAKFRTLTPTQARELAQIMRYGGDYDKIVKALAKMSKLNIQDIYKIFEEVAKSDYQFASRFYKYRYKKFIPYKYNDALQTQVRAITSLSANEYINLTKTLGFATKTESGYMFYDIAKAYQNLLDTAVINVAEGKSTFNYEMSRAIKELATSGLKTVNYPGGKKINLQSAVRMALDSGITNLHNELQIEFGKQFDADGVEISAHGNPAPDHMYVQGKQFSKEEYNKFQNNLDAVSYDGIEFPAVSEETGYDRRSIGQYNCKHYIFSIILGVSKPAYSNDELQNIIDKNNKGFDFNGKHYNSLYEGTQLQRKIELQLRKEKDNQVAQRALGEREEAEIAQIKINNLIKEYNKLLKATKLPSKLERAKVSGYRKIKVVIE